jgi:superfamily II DNA/RNA helicase/HKD family nuclease
MKKNNETIRKKSSFITNEDGSNLRDRFRKLLEGAKTFNALTGYFYTSGFYELSESLEETESIRILVGMGTDFTNNVEEELSESEDSKLVEEGVTTFKKWIKDGKVEIKAHATKDLHSKLYITTYDSDNRDIGRVVTGSSNFTKSGLVDNLEFNVELHRPEDHEYATLRFEELWAESIDVGEEYIETIETKTWLNNTITPYQLYLKFLYEYFKDDINQSHELELEYTPKNFKKYSYQEQAVVNARRILDEYGGVFLSDVVGLGKTYMATILAQDLPGRNLVIAPPNLLKKSNPGSWKNAFSDFNEPADFYSIGKLEKLAAKDTDKYDNVFIDESHGFRNEDTQRYEHLAAITRGKRVILVTATPLNNTPTDILNQMKLFQKTRNSTIPGVKNLQKFFKRLQKNLKDLDRQEDYEEYMRVVKENGEKIRSDVLRHVMVRRTRDNIEKYFKDDLEKQGLSFPEIKNPEPFYYEFNDKEEALFERSLRIVNKDLKYTRYMPLLHLKEGIPSERKQGQKNMKTFMKILLVKRLESSFYAFKQSLKRFLYSYEQVLNQLEDGTVYVSSDYSHKIYELLENDDIDKIQKLIDEDKAEAHSSKSFKPSFRKKLENDRNILEELLNQWQQITRDPKLEMFVKKLKNVKELKNEKLIIFSESKETVEYLKANLIKAFGNTVISMTGDSSASVREEVISNFDANAEAKKDDYRLLVCTDVLSEGVNLHRSNVVINYDIPWNPTKLMQRVGRVNRVDTSFDTVHTFNFFPTTQANREIKLKEAAEAKISLFIETLGNDAKVLTEGEEIKAHDLFEQLNSVDTITGGSEEKSELAYLKVIREVRDSDPDMFQKVKVLPKKARSARKSKEHQRAVVSYMQKGGIDKFYISENNDVEELDFFTTATYLESDPSEKRKSITEEFYPLLSQNKERFKEDTTEKVIDNETIGRGYRGKVVKILSSKDMQNCQKFTEEEEDYIKSVIKYVEEGALPKQTLKKVSDGIDETGIDPMKILAVLRKNIDNRLLQKTRAETGARTEGPREIVISEYLTS